MRDDRDQPRKAETPLREVPCDGKTFFDSFYAASVQGSPDDRATIASTSDLEVRFHYNAVENAILRALVRREPPPAGPAVGAWRALRIRRGLRLLDLGSGAGHWIDFFRDVVLVQHVVGIEIADAMLAFLERKYAETPAVTVLRADVSLPNYDPAVLGAPFHYISAIGVMFHIVDDDAWRRVVHLLARMLRPDGLLFVGGDFGPTTRNVQFHRTDRFRNWREFATAAAADGEIRVNKRVRSLADWTEVVTAAGLRIVDLVRAEREPGISTPENDVLVLERRPTEATREGSA